MVEPIRRASAKAFPIFIVTHISFTTIINLIFFAGNWFRPITEASNGWINGTLVANLVMIVVIVGIIILGVGRLRLYDIGVIWSRLPSGFIVAFGVWMVAQVIHLVAGSTRNGAILWHPQWEWQGSGRMMGLLVAQLFGNALFEELAFRGFLFPQLYLRFEALAAYPWRRFFFTLLVSQVIFALTHIPNRIYLGLPFDVIAVDILALTFWGILYTLIYMRTDNLFLTIFIHALGNAPTLIFATSPSLDDGNASLLYYALVVFTIFIFPLLWVRWTSFRDARQQRGAQAVLDRDVV